jgi:hypothetical protein
MPRNLLIEKTYGPQIELGKKLATQRDSAQANAVRLRSPGTGERVASSPARSPFSLLIRAWRLRVRVAVTPRQTPLPTWPEGLDKFYTFNLVASIFLFAVLLAVMCRMAGVR